MAAQNKGNKWLASELKKQSRKLSNKAETMELAQKRNFYGTTDAQKEIKAMGLKSVGNTTTSVKGFSYPSGEGYQMDKTDARRIEIYNTGKSKFEQIVSALRSKGYSFDVQEYSSFYMGSVGAIKNIKKLKK